MTEPTNNKPASTYVDFGVHGGSEWAKNSEQATVYNNGEEDNVDGVLGGGGVKISAGYFLPELKDDYRIGLGGQVVAAGALNGVDYYKIDTDGQSYNGEHVKNARTIGVGLLFNLTAGITLDPVEANSGAAAGAVTSDPKPASFELGGLLGASYLAGYRPLNSGIDSNKDGFNDPLPGTQALQGLGLTVGAEATYFLGVGEGKGDLGINLRFTSTRGKTAKGALREEEEKIPLRYLQVGITGRIGSISSKPKAEPAPAPVVVAPPPEPTPEPEPVVALPPPEPTPEPVAAPLPPQDQDGDGVSDETDACETVSSNGYKGPEAPLGCPKPEAPKAPLLSIEQLPPTDVVIEKEKVTWITQHKKANGELSEREEVFYYKGDEGLDPDKDGLTNEEERLISVSTDPNAVNNAEIIGAHPGDPDTDNDGVFDGDDQVITEDLTKYPQDVDQDGWVEALDADSNANKIPDGEDGTVAYSAGNPRRRKPVNEKDLPGSTKAAIAKDDPAREFVEVVDITTALKARGEIALTDITFEHNKATLTPQAIRILTQAAEQLKQDDLKDLRIEIGGHANTKGSASHNLILSGERAAAVRDFLISLGVPEGNLKSEGYGESLPVKSDGEQCSEVPAKGEGDQVCNGAEDLDLSRRVVFKVVD